MKCTCENWEKYFPYVLAAFTMWKLHGGNLPSHYKIWECCPWCGKDLIENMSEVSSLRSVSANAESGKKIEPFYTGEEYKKLLDERDRIRKALHLVIHRINSNVGYWGDDFSRKEQKEIRYCLDEEY